jgi:polyisoprenyl-phosphate glycosyltransferase
MFYWIYRLLFRISTGRRIRFGNFSLIPAAMLRRVVALPDLWNNYAAALVKARLPLQMVPCARGERLDGKSKMGLIGLILHGLGAISVHSEVFGARALIASTFVMVGALGLGLAATIIRLTTKLAIPGWATYAVGLSLIVLLQAVTLTVFFVFLILHSRSNTLFVPGRDYEYFIEEVVNSPASERQNV